MESGPLHFITTENCKARETRSTFARENRSSMQIRGEIMCSDQPNRERSVLQIRLSMVEEYQVQLLNVSVLELLTLQVKPLTFAQRIVTSRLSVRMVTGHRESAETKDG